MKIKVGIVGGAGYTGGELIRLLIQHPNVAVSFIHSRSNAGHAVVEIHPDLVGETDLVFTADNQIFEKSDIDVLFLCVGHGEARNFLSANKVSANVRVIDLSQDFRLKNHSSLNGREFVYGLPELNREAIRSAANIANPGCFATALQLGLLPMANEGILKEVYATGITGSTGAGQGLSSTAHFSWRANNIQAYKTLTHQHLNEIHQSVHQLQKKFPATPADDGGINFVPWRGDFTRGIFISSMMSTNWELAKLIDLYNNYFDEHPFTIMSQQDIFLKQVVNTNKCVIQLEKVGSKFIVHSAIDNLLKGASGQAVQNMNLMFGLDECAGLRLKASAF